MGMTFVLKCPSCGLVLESKPWGINLYMNDLGPPVTLCLRCGAKLRTGKFHWPVAGPGEKAFMLARVIGTETVLGALIGAAAGAAVALFIGGVLRPTERSVPAIAAVLAAAGLVFLWRVLRIFRIVAKIKNNELEPRDRELPENRPGA